MIVGIRTTPFQGIKNNLTMSSTVSFGSTTREEETEKAKTAAKGSIIVGLLWWTAKSVVTNAIIPAPLKTVLKVGTTLLTAKAAYHWLNASKDDAG